MRWRIPYQSYWWGSSRIMRGQVKRCLLIQIQLTTQMQMSWWLDRTILPKSYGIWWYHLRPTGDMVQFGISQTKSLWWHGCNNDFFINGNFACDAHCDVEEALPEELEVWLSGTWWLRYICLSEMTSKMAKKYPYPILLHPRKQLLHCWRGQQPIVQSEIITIITPYKKRVACIFFIFFSVFLFYRTWLRNGLPGWAQRFPPPGPAEKIW